MLLQALEEEGGVEYLRSAARKQPAAFLSLLGKLLPAEIRASLHGDGEPLLIIRDFTGVEFDQVESERPASEESPEPERPALPAGDDGPVPLTVQPYVEPDPNEEPPEPRPESPRADGRMPLVHIIGDQVEVEL
jgi:hypothetical protein